MLYDDSGRPIKILGKSKEYDANGFKGRLFPVEIAGLFCEVVTTRDLENQQAYCTLSLQRMFGAYANQKTYHVFADETVPPDSYQFH